MKSAYARFGVKKCASMHVARTHASGTWEAFPWSTPLGQKGASLEIWVVFGMVQWFSGDSRNKSQAVAAKKLCPGLISIYNMYLESQMVLVTRLRVLQIAFSVYAIFGRLPSLQGNQSE